MATDYRALAVGLSVEQRARLLAFPKPKTVRDHITEMFQQLGKTTTAAEALAMAEKAGAEGAALIEVATLAKRRAYALGAKDAFGDRS